MSQRICLLLILTLPLIDGCAAAARSRTLPVLSAGESPKINLSPLPTVVPVGAHARPARIEVRDLRPDEERQYYPGLMEPRHWRDAVSMLPAEAFDPSLPDLLEARLLTMSLPDVTLQVDLTSFHFVFDERGLRRMDADATRAAVENKRQETDDRREQDRKDLEEQQDSWSRTSGEAPDDTDSGNSGGKLIGEFLFWSGRALVRTGIDRTKYSDFPQQSPEFITDQCVEGLNCHLDATITEMHPAASPQSIVIRVRRTASQDPTLPMQPQIAGLVEEALDELCEKVADAVLPMP